MHSILYEQSGCVRRIGPFATEGEAMAAARKAENDGEIDIHEQRVYHLDPGHRLIELSADDLGVT